MTTPTFTPPRLAARSGLAMKSRPRVRRVEFEGGAYSQRSEDGPNPVARDLTAQFRNCTAAERDEILSFFEHPTTGVTGVTAFYYTHPGDDAARLWTAKDWGYAPSRSGLRWDVSVSLREENDIV